MNKKIFALVICLVLALVSAVGTTLAYFNWEETAHNVITTGSFTGIAIVEKTLDEDGSEIDIPLGEDGKYTIPGYVYPGDEKMKKVFVRNNVDSAESWIRAAAEVSISCPNAPADFQPDLGLITVKYNTEDWQEGDDGFWYCKEPVAPGAETKPLFTYVDFSGDMGNEYKKAELFIDITAQAVQTANNPGGDSPAVTQAQGWPAP